MINGPPSRFINDLSTLVRSSDPDLATFWNFDVDVATVGFAIISLRIFIKQLKQIQMLEIFETCVELCNINDFYVCIYFITFEKKI